MKRPGNIAVCLAGWMALNASLCAADSLAPDAKTLLHKRVMHAGMQPAAPAAAPAANPLPDNPYSIIVVRNIFGLIPPAPPPDPNANKEAGLPKITPAGIMGVFGSWQVLFKVSSAQPAAGVKDEFYTLSEGQRQDDIEVVKIDDVKSIVTFDNHGTTQMLPLSDAPSGSSGGSGGGGGPSDGMMPGVSGAGGGNGPGGFTRFGAGYNGNNGGTPNGTSGFNNSGSDAGNGANGGTDFGNAVSTAGNYQPTKDNPPASLESQILLMEYNRAKAQQEGSPQAFLIPPTPLTQFNTPDGNAPAAP